MPDNDIVHHVLVPCWQTAGQLLRGGHPSLNVAGAANKALAKSLRQGGGLPARDQMADLLYEFQAGQVTTAQARTRLNSIEYEHNGSRHIKVAAQATKQLMVEIHDGASFLDAQRAIAERFCWRLLDHQFLGRLVPELVGTRFADHNEAAAFEAECKTNLAPAIPKLATQLLEDSTGANRRAPRLGVKNRRSTEELLALNLLTP